MDASRFLSLYSGLSAISLFKARAIGANSRQVIRLLPPCILKRKPLWSGRQVCSNTPCSISLCIVSVIQIVSTLLLDSQPAKETPSNRDSRSKLSIKVRVRELLTELRSSRLVMAIERKSHPCRSDAEYRCDHSSRSASLEFGRQCSLESDINIASVVHCSYYEKLYGKRCAADLIDLGLFEVVHLVSALLWRIDSGQRACFHGNTFGTWCQLKYRGKLLNLTFRRLTEANNSSVMDMETTSSKPCRQAKIRGEEKRMLSDIIAKGGGRSILRVHDPSKRNVRSKSCSRARDVGEWFAILFLLTRRTTFNNISL